MVRSRRLPVPIVLLPPLTVREVEVLRDLVTVELLAADDDDYGATLQRLRNMLELRLAGDL